MAMASHPQALQDSHSLAETDPSKMRQFHQFTRLPPELRQMIWLLSMEPRDLILTTRFDKRPRPPAVLHACRESWDILYRRHYVRAFFSRAFPRGPRRWVWANFALDTVHLHPSWLKLRKNAFELPLIQKMVLDGRSGARAFYDWYCDVMRRRMPALREVTVRCTERDEDDDPWWLGWAVVFETLYYSRGEAPVPFHMRVLGEARPCGGKTLTELNTDNYRRKYRSIFSRYLRLYYW
ncbi:hypothetical protein PG990_001920 [Apiospora arundinis]